MPSSVGSSATSTRITTTGTRASRHSRCKTESPAPPFSSRSLRTGSASRMIAAPMTGPTPQETSIGFDGLGLSEAVLAAVREVGYESPSPIQRAAIPPLLEGKDLLGQAQTGTGKTAAFALPLLSRLDLKLAEPQLLVLTPTRELAIQVAEAMQTYARHMKGFHVLPVYGGQ